MFLNAERGATCLSGDACWLASCRSGSMGGGQVPVVSRLISLRWSAWNEGLNQSSFLFRSAS